LGSNSSEFFRFALSACVVIDKIPPAGGGQRIYPPAISTDFEAASRRTSSWWCWPRLGNHHPWAALNAGKHFAGGKAMALNSGHLPGTERPGGAKGSEDPGRSYFLFNPAVEYISLHLLRGLGELRYLDSTRINWAVPGEDHVVWDLARTIFSIVDYLLDESPCP